MNRGILKQDDDFEEYSNIVVEHFTGKEGFMDLTVTLRAAHFWPERSNIDFRGTKRTWIMKIPRWTPPKIKFRIFWCYVRKPEMKF